MTIQTETQRELLMLRSGMLGPQIDLDWLVSEDLISAESAGIYLSELGASNTMIRANDNRGKLNIAIEKYHAVL